MHKHPLNPQEKKILSLSALGGLLELYDFTIYGIFSVYFAQQFFPANNAILSIIESYLVFILGYLARPIGGLIFSHIGDEHGRKKVLVITIVLMGLSSIGIGILPTYATLGIFAPIALLLLRLLQGFALGGELPTTYVYISESLTNKRGLGFGVTMMGVNSGLLLGMAFNQLLTNFMNPAELIHYGWRIPFIFGGILCLVSYKIRKTLQETLAFKKIQAKPDFPLAYLFKHHARLMCSGIALTAIMSSLVVGVAVFMPTYLSIFLHVDNRFISEIMTLAMILNVSAIYFSGRISDLYRSPYLLLSIFLLGSLILIPTAYLLIAKHYFMSGVIILVVLAGIAALLTPLILTNLFPAKVRLTGVAVCYNVGFTFFGGLAPVIISTLIHAGFNVYKVPLLYLLSTLVICAAGAFYSKRTNIYTE